MGGASRKLRRERGREREGSARRSEHSHHDRVHRTLQLLLPHLERILLRQQVPRGVPGADGQDDGECGRVDGEVLRGCPNPRWWSWP